jgi:ketosteroid isomerase-like protein
MSDLVKWDWPHTKKWPTFSGQQIDIVKKMFLAGEAMNVDNFVKLYTENAVYQFGNFPIAHGPEEIRIASGSFKDKGSFLGEVEGVHHHLKNIWEVEKNTLVVNMDVTYIRHDGKVFTLPCCDIIRFEGNKVKELKIFMDISPVLAKAE